MCFPNVYSQPARNQHEFTWGYGCIYGFLRAGQSDSLNYRSSLWGPQDSEYQNLLWERTQVPTVPTRREYSSSWPIYAYNNTGWIIYKKNSGNIDQLLFTAKGEKAIDSMKWRHLYL